MTSPRPARGVKGVLLDIEGTTTPMAFVHDVLFPFARARLRSYLADHLSSAALTEVIDHLARDHAADCASGASPPPWPDRDRADPQGIATYLEWLMDRDRKAGGLKEIQGRIWEDGYRSGELTGQVFDDVPAALRRWHERGTAAYIYSSGSVLAQRLLFGSTAYGDLTPLIAGHFDTAVGPKVSPDSYRRIAEATGIAAPALLFVSDSLPELDAAGAAGCQTTLSIRPGNQEIADAHGHPVVRSFDELP